MTGGARKGEAGKEPAVKSVRSDDAQTSYPVSLDESAGACGGTLPGRGSGGLMLGVGEKLGVGAGVKLPLGVYDALGV